LRHLWVLLGLIAHLWGAPLALTPDEKAWLDATPRIEIGVMYGWEPLSFVDYRGHIMGISVDLLGAMNAHLGGKIAIVGGQWDTIYEKAKSGTLHAIMDITPNLEREAFFNFTKPHLHIPHAIVTAQSSPPVLALRELEGKILALEKGFFTNTYVQKNFPKIRIKNYANTTECLDAVMRGEAHAYVGNRAVVEYKIKQEWLDSLKIDGLDTTRTGSMLALGVAKMHTPLESILQKAFDALGEEEKNAIFAHWARQKWIDLALTAQEQAWLAAHPQVNYVCDPKGMPFMSIDANGTQQGIIAKEMQKIANLTHTTFQQRSFVSWREALHAAQTGDIDIIVDALEGSSLSDTHLAVPTPVKTPIVIVAQKGKHDHFVADLAQLHGKSIAMVKEYGYAKALLANYPDLHYYPVEDVYEALEAVAIGKYDAALAPLAMATHAIYEQGVDNLQIIGKTDATMTVALWVRQAHAPLASILEKALKESSFARYDTMLSQWEEVVAKPRIDYLLIAEVLGTLALLMLGLFLWNFSLKRTVARKTQELLAFNQNLEKIVQERTQALQEATQAKSRFLANMSHEIRTPMNAIIGMSYLALQSTQEPSTRNYIAKIERAAKNLLGILNDILDVSKIEARKMELEVAPFAFGAMMQSVEELFALKAQEKGVALTFAIDPTIPSVVVGDALRLSQVLVNLIGNALKFTSQGSVTVTARLKTLDEETLRLSFEVQDSGCGIDEAFLPHIFDPFAQGDASVTRHFGGTGLGLAICQSLVAQIGGTLGVESRVGEGSRFFFEAKLSRASQAQTAHIVAAQHPKPIQMAQTIAGRRILVVEDNELNQELAMALLKQAAMEAHLARNGQEALDKVAHHNYDAILMDIQMPVMDGIEATKRLRAMGYTLPIIAMTASIHEGEKLLELGMDDLLLKPIDVANFYALLEKYLGTSAPQMPAQPSRALTIEGIEYDKALAHMGGDEALLEAQLRGFVQTHRTFIDQLQSALVQGDSTTALRMAHTLKGLCGTLGATATAQKARAVETHLREHGIDTTLSSLVTALQGALERLLDAITAALPSPSTPLFTLDSDIDKEAKRLDEELLALDTQALHTVELFVEAVGAKGCENAPCEALREAVKHFRFDEARALLGEIISRRRG